MIDDVDVLRLLVQPDLADLLTARHRGTELTVSPDPGATVGHVVQSVGIPLTEVGELRLDGVAVGPDARTRPGELLVSARTRPQALDPVRFLLDVHLGSLARRLRLLGLDTGYPGPAASDDAGLVRTANREQRVLLSQDRGLLRRRALQRGAFVRGAGATAQLEDVLDRFAPDLDPWTRCPRCNGPLRPAEPAEVADELEPGTRRTYTAFARCNGCGRVYWHGAHWARLDALVRHAEQVVAQRRYAGGA